MGAGCSFKNVIHNHCKSEDYTKWEKKNENVISNLVKSYRYEVMGQGEPPIPTPDADGVFYRFNREGKILITRPAVKKVFGRDTPESSEYMILDYENFVNLALYSDHLTQLTKYYIEQNDDAILDSDIFYKYINMGYLIEGSEYRLLDLITAYTFTHKNRITLPLIETLPQNLFLDNPLLRAYFVKFLNAVTTGTLCGTCKDGYIYMVFGEHSFIDIMASGFAVTNGCDSDSKVIGDCQAPKFNDVVFE